MVCPGPAGQDSGATAELPLVGLGSAGPAEPANEAPLETASDLELPICHRSWSRSWPLHVPPKI